MQRFTGIFLFLLLFLPLYSITHLWIEIPSFLITSFDWLPFVVFSIGLILCVIFYDSREFCLLIFIWGIFWLLQSFIWSKGLPGIKKEQLFDIISMLIPFNVLALYFLRERGLLNQYGLKRLVIILFEIGAVVLIIHYNHLGLSQNFVKNLFDSEVTQQTVLKQTTIVVWLLTVLILLFHWLFMAGFKNAVWLLALVSLLVSMHTVQNVLIATLYFIITGLIVIGGVIINAYHLAYKDELTLLPSRRALKQQLLSLGKNYSIAMLDVDHFKKLNDTYGHDVGDDVLKLLASQLVNVNGGGKAFRYGGEEFTVVFPGKDADFAAEQLDILREEIASTPFVIRHKKRPRKKPEQKRQLPVTKQINITVSIGVADKQIEHADPQAVIKSADKALYKAKERGRNQVVIA